VRHQHQADKLYFALLPGIVQRVALRHARLTYAAPPPPPLRSEKKSVSKIRLRIAIRMNPPQPADFAVFLPVMFSVTGRYK